MAEETVNEAALQVITSLREANQAIAWSVVAAQERNAKFAHSLFTSGVEVLKSHAEETQTLLQELEQQTQKQQAVFQKLVQELGQDARQELEQQMQKQQENFQKLAQELEQQAQKQQEAFQKLMQASMEVSKNLLHTPRS
jgi:uncharacterized protein YukE